MPKHWLPLESNPSVMNSYASKLGLDVGSTSFHDVFSTEEWALSMVPRPVFAVLMLFPIKESTENVREEQKNRILKDGQHVSKNVYYMKQYVGNACGTVGILHAIGNSKNEIALPTGSYLDNFYKKTSGMTPEEIANFLEDDDEIEEAHEDAALEGESEQPEDGLVDNHFICFSVVEGHLYELGMRPVADLLIYPHADGRKEFPINHGPSSKHTLLEDAIRVIRTEFMEKDPEEVRFTMVALASGAGEQEEGDDEAN